MSRGVTDLNVNFLGNWGYVAITLAIFKMLIYGRSYGIQMTCPPTESGSTHFMHSDYDN